MSVEASTGPPEEIQIDDDVEEIEEDEEEEEVDEEEEEVEEEDEEEEITHGRSTGRGLTLKTLLKEGVLQPGEGAMTINYLGNKFKGDLLPDGRIRSQETNKIFGTPSAWAIYCKKIVNPDKKSGCGWASVRYRGRKLDSYKNNWYRQKRLEFEREGEALDEEEMSDSDSEGPHEQEIVEFEIIGNRHPNHDMNTMVELTSFQSLGRMQPFNVTMSSSAMAVIDVHAHVSTSEVVGYLAGQWDVTNHNLIVSHALPVRCRLGDGEKGSNVEKSLYDEMEKLNLSLVGWYHTHPFSPPLPTLRDIDSQLEYEMKMKGTNDSSYTPCIGIIVSPYVRGGGGQGATKSGFWVMPPPEHKPQEYGRPMSIQFTVVQDAFIPKDALIHMCKCIRYYRDSPDSVIFSDIFQDRHSYWDKLKTAIKMCVPKDHYGPLLDYLAKLLELKNYVSEVNSQPSPKPKTPVPGGMKPPDSPEVIALDDPEPSASVPSAVNTLPSEVAKKENSLMTVSSNNVGTIDSASENSPSKIVESGLPESQQMEVSYNQESEKSSQEPHESLSDPKTKEDFHPIIYRERSPPPYQPPPYPAQFQPPPYQPPLRQQSPQGEVFAHQDQKPESSHAKEYYSDEYIQKQREKVADYEQDVSQEAMKYSEPPPDYHQQHFTISASTYEASSTPPPSRESCSQEDSRQVDENTDERREPDEEIQRGPQFSESTSNDPWAQRIGERISDTEQQSSPQPRSLHQQTQPQHLQSQSQQLHQQSQSQQPHAQLLHQQSQPQQLHLQPQSQQVHQLPSTVHQQSQSNPLHQDLSRQRHQDLQQQQRSQELHKLSQSQQLHQQLTSQAIQSLHHQLSSQSQQLQASQLLQQSSSLQLHQLHQKSQLHQLAQSQQAHQQQQQQQQHQGDPSDHEELQQMDVEPQVSQP